jgi:hypothetical protein
MDQSGNLITKKTYGDTRENTACSIQLTSDNSILIGGTTSTLNNDYQAMLLKTDLNGDTIWSNNLGQLHSDIAYHAIQTNDGGFAITGMSDYFVTHHSMFLFKTNGIGSLNNIFALDDKKIPLKIFPDPSVDYLYITVDEEPVNKSGLVIYDITGKIIRIIQSFSFSTSINISDLNAGFYFIRIINDKKVYTGTFQKI